MKIPEGITPQAACTVPSNFVAAFQAATHDFRLPLPWPRPENYVPEQSEAAILVWGAASSVGLYAVQILKYYGYKNVIVTASGKHHDMLKEMGAKAAVDYRSDSAVEEILNAASGPVKYVLDCIGSLEGSVESIEKIAKAGSIVSIMLPVILRYATDNVEPVYEMDVEKVIEWNEGVEIVGTRTHFYTKVSVLTSCVSLILINDRVERVLSRAPAVRYYARIDG
jgi:NADPH:quinone reductase-like Zn-dependent oxidoreductase